jgi:hypothetical protein
MGGGWWVDGRGGWEWVGERKCKGIVKERGGESLRTEGWRVRCLR